MLNNVFKPASFLNTTHYDVIDSSSLWTDDINFLFSYFIYTFLFQV